MPLSLLTRPSQSLVKHWYVVFNKADDHFSPLHSLALKGSPEEFGHVLLIHPVTSQHVIMIDPTNSYAHMVMLRLEDSVAKTVAQIAQHVPVLSLIHTPEKFWNLTCLVPSCVTICKYHLGINSRALTPQQLYDDLIENFDATRI